MHAVLGGFGLHVRLEGAGFKLKVCVLGVWTRFTLHFAKRSVVVLPSENSNIAPRVSSLG